MTGLLDRDTQTRHAERLAALHRPGDPLVLPNVWDAGSALVVARAGAKAIATTSGGCAWTVGVADGGGLTREQAVSLIRTVVAAVDLPVTADIERGYGDTPGEVRDTIAAVLEAGAVGVNLEDGGGSPDEHAGRIAAAREAAEAYGVPLFINARTDLYLFGIGEEAGRLDDVIARATLYAKAGASGLFVPKLLDLDALTTLTAATSLPVNVMTGAGAPTVAEFAGSGVARISAGTGLVETAYAHVERAARELLEQGTTTSLEIAADYGEINAAFAGPH